MKYKYIAFIVLFLLFSAFFIISNNNLALKDKENRTIFARSYYGWFVNVIGNIKSITADVIKSNWLPEISSSLNKTPNKK